MSAQLVFFPDLCLQRCVYLLLFTHCGSHGTPILQHLNWPQTTPALCMAQPAITIVCEPSGDRLPVWGQECLPVWSCCDANSRPDRNTALPAIILGTCHPPPGDLFYLGKHRYCAEFAVCAGWVHRMDSSPPHPSFEISPPHHLSPFSSFCTAYHWELQFETFVVVVGQCLYLHFPKCILHCVCILGHGGLGEPHTALHTFHFPLSPLPSPAMT